MFWADKIADEIIKSGRYKPYWVDDMKTPSGRVHIGSVRAVLTHELIYKALKHREKKIDFSYVLEDHDPMDGLPVYVDQEEYKKHLGKPLYLVPSSEPGFKSFADRWGQEYIEIFNKLGVYPKIIWGSELYRSGKMNDTVRLCLNKAGIIRGIYKTLYKKKRPKNWYPFQVLCEKCQKISTTVVTDWDGKKVIYECRVDGLDWTKGCGHKGSVSPFSDEKKIAGKLPWKVEWSCKWKVIGITIEGAGKDHMSAGGSHDFAEIMCKKVLNYPVPYAFSHEFFLVGGKKMSSSKGLGSSAKEISEILPAYLIRFLIARVRFNKQISFDPVGMTIPDLFDNYDKCAISFWKKDGSDKARIYELSQVDKPHKETELPRFRDIANYINLGVDPRTKFKDTETLKERIKYAKIWLDKYAPKEEIFKISDAVPNEVGDLTSLQKKYLEKLSELVEDENNSESLEKKIYKLAKDLNVPSRDAFGAIYITLLGKTHGPKAALLILGKDKSKIIKRLKEVGV